MFKLNKKQMNVKIFRYLSITTFIAVILLSWLFFMSTSNIILDDSYKQTTEAVEQSGEYIESYLDKLKSLSDLISMHPDVIETLVKETNDSKMSVHTLLDVTARSDKRILSIALVSKDGRLLEVGQEMLLKTSSDMMKEEWYMKAKNSHQMPTLTSLRHTEFTMDKDTWVVSVSREIIDENEDHLGVLLIDIDYNFIEDYLNNLQLGNEGYAFIIDRSGNVVYHPDVTYFGDKDKANSLVLLCELDESVDSDLITFKTNIGNSEWTLVGLSSLDNVKFLRRQVIESVFFVSMLVIIIGIAVGIIFTQKMTYPIKKLQYAMKTVGDDFNFVDIPRDSSSEIVELTEQYNLMINKIKNLLEEISTNEKQMRKFELQALESQINPHFLYNTLDTIIWLAEFGETNKVVNVTKSLAELLRLSLKKEEGLITLKDELKHVSCYMDIQMERYKDELDFEVITEINTELYFVPKLILQPIVENSIYHGIREGNKFGKISININEDDKNFFIIISDNGKGFDKKLEEINIKLGGVGIHNVDQRLKLTYGDLYGLKVESKLNEGTRVTYKLPK